MAEKRDKVMLKKKVGVKRSTSTKAGRTRINSLDGDGIVKKG